MRSVESSLPGVLRERADLQPDELAFTFVDYGRDWEGVAESLTWSQVYRRSLNIARELRSRGSTGDRVLISAPQGLDYVAGFLGALQAGMIAVPLSEPLGGASDERFLSVLRDASPAAILTTSAVAANIAEYVRSKSGEPVPSVIEIDLLDLDSQNGPAAEPSSRPDIAYLQYTSGSTRTPAGVEISHKNIAVNVEQVMSAYFDDNGGVALPDTTVVSWLPFFHDMGLIVGIILPVLGGNSRCPHEPGGILAATGAVDAIAGQPTVACLRQRRTWVSNWRRERRPTRTWPGLDLGAVHNILNGAERVQPATLRRFAERFAPLQPSPQGVGALVWARGGHGVRGDRRIVLNHRPPYFSNPRN